jgi:anti-sigma B factor antagonist
MNETKVSMKVRKTNGASIVDISGEVSGFAENTLMDAYTEASSAGAKAIILNFNGLEYMNSSGIGLLVTMLIRTQRQGQQLLAYGLNDHYRQIFELTRLNEAIEIYDSESEAIQAAMGHERR